MTTLVSPVGTIVFMALDAPRANKYKGGKEEYSIRLKFDGSCSKWKEQIAAVNPKIIVETDDGGFCVNATTKYAPTVTDAEGHTLSHEDVPSFGVGASGQAIMTVQTYEGQRGNSINLSAVGLVNLEHAEGVESGGTSLNALREALKLAKN